MSLKVIVDVGVGATAEVVLRELGHDVVAVRDLNPRMDDREIIEKAADEGRLVVTTDKDFKVYTTFQRIPSQIM